MCILYYYKISICYSHMVVKVAIRKLSATVVRIITMLNNDNVQYILYLRLVHK